MSDGFDIFCWCGRGFFADTEEQAKRLVLDHVRADHHHPTDPALGFGCTPNILPGASPLGTVVSVCDKCSAVVLVPAQHQAWHEQSAYPLDSAPSSGTANPVEVQTWGKPVTWEPADNAPPSEQSS